MDSALYIIRRHDGLPEIYGDSSVAVQAARAYFSRSLEEIKRRLRDGRPYLLGDDFNVADLLLKTCLDWAGFVQISLPDSLESYSTALGGRAAYAAAMKKNFTPASTAALAGAAE
jgi:glutathione S-transferase